MMILTLMMMMMRRRRRRRTLMMIMTLKSAWYCKNDIVVENSAIVDFDL